ncbi:MAG: HNH endonuclease signature motif containing protein [Candidatus Babeliales bacterium]|jgi:predicted RNA-binding Zn-ribbon protein involved in translation (DUF1610 family)
MTLSKYGRPIGAPRLQEYTGLVDKYGRTAGKAICEVCGKEFIRRLSKLRESIHHYCSRACRNKRNLTGEKNPTWKGGRWQTPQGYIIINLPDGHTLEHRLVMELHLGRKLTDEELVHHKNGIKDDNRIENLELTTKAEHARHHMIQRMEMR